MQTSLAPKRTFKVITDAEEIERILQIRRISYAEILSSPQSATLLATYSSECSIPEIGETNPQGGTYSMMERAGILQCWGVFDGGEMVGFASVIKSVLPHYGKKVATVESIYVAPSHRPQAGKRLMEVLELDALDSDCKVILYSAPTGSRFAQMMEKTDRYRHTNEVFCRELY